MTSHPNPDADLEQDAEPGGGPAPGDAAWAAQLAASEKRFRNIIERTADGIVVVADDGIVRYANPAAERLFRQDHEELEGEHFGFPVSAGETTEVDLHSRGGGHRVAEMQVVASEWDGQPVLLATLRDVTDRKHLEEAQADQARERARRTEAEQATQRLQLLADAGALLASSLSLVGPLSRLVRLLVPRAADWSLLVLTEEAKDGLPQRCFYAHVEPERERALADLAPVYQEPWRFGDVLPHQAEQVEEGERWLAELPEGIRDRFIAAGLVSALLLPLELGGRQLGYLTLARTGRDVPPSGLTGRRYEDGDLPLGRELGRRVVLALESARLYRQAEEASRMRDEFMAKVSHEMRTPLQAILGWTAILKSDPSDAERIRRGVEVIERNAENQVHLIEDILDVSRIITGKLSLQREPTDVRPLVRSTLESLLPTAEKHKVELVPPVDDEEAATRFTVFADPQRLEQVITNLTSNAIRHSPEGESVRVEVEASDGSGEDGADEVMVSVSDHGDGIDPEILPKIFSPFRQGGTGNGNGSGALGLGLAIVRQLVEMHGGHVEAESAGEGMGATFRVYLPRMTEEGKVAPQVASVAQEREVGAASGDLAGLRVAVVDDEIDARELLETALGDLGAQVWTAGSAEDFFRSLDEHVERDEIPDVLISDIGMPGTDGYGLISRLRERSEATGGAIPAVALTGFARPEDQGRALDAGFQYHMAKPAPVSELAARVRSMVDEDC